MSNAGQIITAVVGAIVGAVVGYFFGPSAGFAVFSLIAGIGTALFPTATEKPRPQELQFQTSAYGGVITVLFGTRKLSGNCLWYANYQSHEQSSEGGKGGSSQVTGYSYSVSLAFGLCVNTAGAAGTTITRIWSGKNELDLASMISNDQIRIYDGTQTEPDSHMAGFLARAPVYKGLCWVVLPNFDLGNSPYIPNLTFEVGGTLEITPNLAYYSQFLTTGTGGAAGYPPPEVFMPQWVDITDRELWDWSSSGWVTDKWVDGANCCVFHNLNADSWNIGFRFTKIRITMAGAVTPGVSITNMVGSAILPYTYFDVLDEIVVEFSESLEQATVGGQTVYQSDMAQIQIYDDDSPSYSITKIEVLTLQSVPSPGPYGEWPY